MNGTPEPLVSICIPTYNRAGRLRRAVQRVLSGSHSNVEVVISDNGSSDDTPAVAAQLAAADARVRYFRHPRNRGPTANFEFARTQARGPYFIWHGDDDYLAPDYIALCVRELERNPALVLASGRAAYHAGDQVVRHYGNVQHVDGRGAWLRMLRYLLTVRDNSIFCGVYRRERVNACTFPNIIAGDWAWMAQVLAEGPARVLPQALAYREESDNASSSLDRNAQELGLPAWHAKREWLVMPLFIANQVAIHSALAARLHPLQRLALWQVLFWPLLAKRIARSVGLAIPFGRELYRWLTRARR